MERLVGVLIHIYSSYSKTKIHKIKGVQRKAKECWPIILTTNLYKMIASFSRIRVEMHVVIEGSKYDKNAFTTGSHIHIRVFSGNKYVKDYKASANEVMHPAPELES